MDLISVRHPEYLANLADWQRYRDAYVSGREFVDRYLVKFSARESPEDFRNRKLLTYSPSHAKAAINDVKNAVHQRMVDITRVGGSQHYRDSVTLNVDGANNTMNSFIGRKILPELLPLGKVGVFVDSYEPGKPYLYTYEAEDILSWSEARDGFFDRLLLRTRDYDLSDLGLPARMQTTYRYLEQTPSGVREVVYDTRGETISESESTIPRIPFVVVELSHPLMCDVADLQIALLNMASSDINYSLKSNFPFYVEQDDPTNRFWGREAIDTDPKNLVANNEAIKQNEGTASKASEANQPVMTTGSVHGRTYPKGANQPAFIHPSAEPLRVSMEKQDKIKAEIRELINLNLASLQSRRASAESKQEDSRNKEEGLSYIGLELQYLERRIAAIWEMYDRSGEVASISYPTNYNLRSDRDRRDEANELLSLGQRISAPGFQRAIAKRAASITMSPYLSGEELARIHKEIDDAGVLYAEPEVIHSSVEAGLIDIKTASIALGYPESAHVQAKIDHAERLARIAIAQGGQMNAARGISDADGQTTEEERSDDGS